MPCHPTFNLLWASKCQPKHKVFFWLLLHDKLNTRKRLMRRHMKLESYSCENCILQRIETSYHLFLRCNIAERCWPSIGITTPRVLCQKTAVQRLTRQLRHPCSIEIIILRIWSIWKCRNGWLFDGIPPTIERCRRFLGEELQNLTFRLKPCVVEILLSWIQSVQL
jgi:hypothetical protein